MNRKTIWRLDQAKRNELEPEWENFADEHKKDMPWLFYLWEDDMGPPLIQYDHKTGKLLYDEEERNNWINHAAWKELETILEGYVNNSLILSIDEAGCLNVYRDVNTDFSKTEYIVVITPEYEPKVEHEHSEDNELKTIVENIYK